MAKLKLDQNSLKAFFFNHTEKLVLVLVLLMLGLFIWSGASLEGIGATQNPADLASKAQRANQHIETDTWQQVATEYLPKTDHSTRTKAGRNPTVETFYPLNTPLSASSRPPMTRRLDPQLFPVTDLEVTVVTGPLALKAAALRSRADFVDPYAELKNMEQKVVEPPKKKAPKKKKANRGMGSYESGMMEDMMMEDAGEGMADYTSEMMGMGMEGMAGGAGTPTGPVVRADAKKFEGYRPSSTSGMDGSSVIGRTVHVVSVKGLVPYQQLWEEYERVFAQAEGYVPGRDTPRFLSFRAQRAEVSGDPATPLKWGYIWWTDKVYEQLPKMQWAGFPGEIADPKYVLPGILTMPMPPIMMRNLKELSLHSKVPMQEVATNKKVQVAAPELVNPEDAATVSELDDLPTSPGARRPDVPGAGMYGGAGGPMMGGDMGMGMGMEGMMGGMGSEMSMGMGMMAPQIAQGPSAEFLMVRFFDYIQPGKQYVYRVQVVLEDPNHPQNPQMQPHDRIIDDTVRARLAALTAAEEKKTAETKAPVRLYSLTTEWSEPSAPVFVQNSPQAYAGGVKAARKIDVVRAGEAAPGQKSVISVPGEGEPLADVMSLHWDPRFATDVPGITSAGLGTFLNKPLKVNLIEPVSLVYKTIEDYALKADQMVVDLRGGELIPGSQDPKLLIPGEVAIMDLSGNLIIRNELDDWQMFDKYGPPSAAGTPASPTSSGDDLYEEALPGAFEGLLGQP